MMRTLLAKLNHKIGLLLAFLLFSAGAFAQVTYTDTVCAGSQDVVYGITGANPTSTYNWWLASGNGTIDNSISSNDSVIEIDWSAIAGTDTLYAQETTADGCFGDTVKLGIIINALPTVTLAADSVCPGFQANLTFEFTGEAPWIVEYTDGTTNFTDTANATPFVVSLPPYNSSQSIDVTNLTDANTCVADPSTLPTGIPVHIYPQTTTGPIYHY